jgi:hypothetical protein
LPEREKLDAIQYVIDQIDAMKVVRPPEVHIEGGVCFGMTISLLVLIKEVITKTISQQEQIGGVQFIKELFPHKIVKI